MTNEKVPDWRHEDEAVEFDEPNFSSQLSLESSVMDDGTNNSTTLHQLLHPSQMVGVTSSHQVSQDNSQSLSDSMTVAAALQQLVQQNQVPAVSSNIQSSTSTLTPYFPLVATSQGSDSEMGMPLQSLFSPSSSIAVTPDGHQALFSSSSAQNLVDEGQLSSHLVSNILTANISELHSLIKLTSEHGPVTVNANQMLQLRPFQVLLSSPQLSVASQVSGFSQQPIVSQTPIPSTIVNSTNHHFSNTSEGDEEGSLASLISQNEQSYTPPNSESISSLTTFKFVDSGNDYVNINHDKPQEKDTQDNLQSLSSSKTFAFDKHTNCDRNSLNDFPSSRDCRVAEKNIKNSTSQESLILQEESKDAELQPTRKSARLAEFDARCSIQYPTYKPDEYNTANYWCEDCQRASAIECPQHKFTILSDRKVLSHARASMPGVVQIVPVDASVGVSDQNVMVVAKKVILKRTQLGPFQAPKVSSLEEVGRQNFILKIEGSEGNWIFLNPSDESQCNWLMFIRPASVYHQQNLVAYQFGSDIFFMSTRNIESKEELCVGYASHYAHQLGVQPLRPEPKDTEGGNLPCYECGLNFRTPTLLQKHLAVHDQADEASTATVESDEEYKAEKGLRSQLKRASGAKNGEIFSSWKKGSIPNKYRQYQQTAKRRSVRMVCRRGVSDWDCQQCDFIFATKDILDLHILSHNKENGPSEMEVEEVELNVKCPACPKSFSRKSFLVQHVGEHAKSKKTAPKGDPLKPFTCFKCPKGFSTQDKLSQHSLVHGAEENKPLPCSVCLKRFMSQSALACHMKTHSQNKYYQCFLCPEGFDQRARMREHTESHRVGDAYPCNQCSKIFVTYKLVAKHVRCLHPTVMHKCKVCEREFRRPDKLRLHMLKHSNEKKFMCESCGARFKRPDKLKDHMKRIHDPSRVTTKKLRTLDVRPKFKPQVKPEDYLRFIYRCSDCQVGFKRRGMLVNHLTSKHPDVSPSTIPELNLPILRVKHDFHCAYCDKVYKSGSKRKFHILKAHPGEEIPPPGTKCFGSNLPQTFTRETENITTMPFHCHYCPKQYASKAKLVQHQRMKHPQEISVAKSMEKKDLPICQAIRILDENKIQIIQNDGAVSSQDLTMHVQSDHQTVDMSHNNDLLTQAMSELTQTFAEYKPVQTWNAATVVQSIPHSAGLPALPVELSSLLSTAGQTSVTVQGLPTTTDGRAWIGDALYSTDGTNIILSKIPDELHHQAGNI